MVKMAENYTHTHTHTHTHLISAKPKYKKTVCFFIFLLFVIFSFPVYSVETSAQTIKYYFAVSNNDGGYRCAADGEEAVGVGCCEGLRNCDGVCRECCPVSCGSNEYSKKDSDGCDYCEECPTPTETVCAENAITYDVNGCPEQGYEKCSDGMVCENGACRCPYPAQTFNKVTNKCECIFVPIGGNPDTCECYAGQDLVDGICVDPCPDALGMTGFRNSDGQCLCNTEAGYKEISNNNTFCECDEGRNYFNAPDGSCLTCYEITIDNLDQYSYNWDSTDKKSVEESFVMGVWFCGYKKYVDTWPNERWYNPSTKTYCGEWQVLKMKEDGQLVCADCGDGTSFYDGGIATQWGFCACGYSGTEWNSSTGKCESKCPKGATYYYNGKCNECNFHQTYVNGQCGQLCSNGIGDFQDGSSVFNWENWRLNSKDYCSENGEVQQTDGGDCDYRHGCGIIYNVLPTCSYGELISDCVCPSGSKTGYCCALSQIATSSGCETCSGNTVPNSDKTTCEPCAMGTVPNAGKCVACPAGEVVSYNGTSCYTCPEGYEPNENQTRCI